MANPIFPSALAAKQDSSLYSIEREDVSMKTPVDGGYVISRAKHTRTPRSNFKSGFTMLTNADRKLLEDFYALVRGGSVIFDWTDPSSLVVYQVRFAGALAFKYSGRMTTQRWDVSFSLEQA